MTKPNILALVTKITNTYRNIFETKSVVTSKLNQLRTDLETYTNNKVVEGTEGSASETYVDTLIASVRNEVAKLGTFLGTSNTYAGLPTTDQNGRVYQSGDFAHLLQDDGGSKKGLYRYDGNSYVFISGDPGALETFNTLKYTSLNDNVDDKFITPKWVKDYDNSQQPSQAEVDAAAQ